MELHQLTKSLSGPELLRTYKEVLRASDDLAGRSMLLKNIEQEMLRRFTLLARANAVIAEAHASLARVSGYSAEALAVIKSYEDDHA